MTIHDLSEITDVLKAINSMASDINALKSDVDKGKQEIARLNRRNTMLSYENRKLKMENEKLGKRVAELESSTTSEVKVEKDSHNSSIPPTRQTIEQQVVMRTKSLRTPTGRKSGGQKGHIGISPAMTETPNKVEAHHVTTCPHCGAQLPSDAERTCVRRTQVMDITGVLSLPETTEHRSYAVVCPHCHKLVSGKLPTGKCTKILYGPKTQTLVVYLSIVHSIPYNRIRDILKDVFMLPTFSEGTIKNILAKNKSKASPIYNSILDFIERERAAGMDETGVYINKKLSWFWCLQSPRYCFVFADESRGYQALENYDIPRRLEGLTLYTDRHGTYFKLNVKNHQVCLAHLLRNLQYLNELDTSQQWSSRVQALFREAIHLRKTRPITDIKRKDFDERMKRLNDEDLSKHRPELQKMQNALINCSDYLFTFLDHDEVPPDNNSSERTIRTLKVKSKVSGGFRTKEGADEYACFHSLVQTAKRNNISAFIALYDLISDLAPTDNFIETLINHNER